MDSDALWAANLRYDWAMRQFEKERLKKEALIKALKSIAERIDENSIAWAKQTARSVIQETEK